MGIQKSKYAQSRCFPHRIVSDRKLVGNDTCFYKTCCISLRAASDVFSALYAIRLKGSSSSNLLNFHPTTSYLLYHVESKILDRAEIMPEQMIFNVQIISMIEVKLFYMRLDYSF
jgi:hypothetical protein